MGDFSVVAVELRVAGSRVADTAGTARTAMADVGADVQALLAAGWRGRAADGFAEGWDRWRAGAREVVEALDAMGRLLDAAGRDYTAVDAEATSTIATSGQGLR